MDKIITLTPDELQKCKEFSIKSAKSQQAIEFGQSDTKARSISEIARDNLIGKMAEVAFARMLKEDFDIDIPLDFNVYARGKWDDNDLIINGWNIDIKSTRIGHWLLIEWSKLNFRQKQGELPHAFFMCKTVWDMDKDEPLGTVDLVGSISLNKLKAGAPHVYTIRKGDLLPGTRTHLQADNFGVRFRNLNPNWSEVIPYILEHEPPIGVEKDSILRQEYDDKVSRLKSELDNKDRLIAQYRSQRPAPQIKVKKEIEYVVDNEEIARLENELRIAKSQRDEWKNRYYELKGQNSDIDLSKYVDMGLYTEAVTDNAKLQQDNDKLLSEKAKQQRDITTLKGELSDTKTELRDYKRNEKKVLPILRKSVYQQQHQGKCITLEPSQIETIVRKYLNGISPYKISKEMGVSKTSVNMIIRCEYKSEQSLEKILKALHQVNKEGHWGEEKQATLNGLIGSYENSLSTVRDINKIRNKEIKDGIQSIEDYLAWVESKENGDYIEDIEY